MVNYFITWKNVILNPELFFKNMPKSGGYGEPLKFAVISNFIGSLGIFLILFLMGTSSIITNLKSSIGFGILVLIIGLIGLFFYSSIFWIFFKIMGGKGNFEATFRQVSYSSAIAVIVILPILMLYFLDLNAIGGKYVHGISNVRSYIAVILPTILIGGFVFLFIIAPAMVFTDFQTPQPPLISIKVLSATPTSIELQHYGGDVLPFSEIQFTVKKADGGVLRPIIVNSSDRFSVGDIIRLSDTGAGFGNIGDYIEIVAEYNKSYSPKSEIFKSRTQIQN